MNLRAKRLMAAFIVLVGAVLALTAAPAQAAPSAAAVGCNGSFNRGPYFYAGVGASVTAKQRMVMDIQGPWTDPGVQAHMWHWYNGQSQYWCLQPTPNGS